MTLDELQVEALRLGVSLGPEELRLFDLYMKAIIDTNSKFNLTSIRDEGEIVRKHFLDSLAPASKLQHAKSLVDVGAGAGFPGIPLAIACSELRVTLVDSLEKRVRFLTEVISILGLEGRVTAIAGRAEDVGRQAGHRERYDVAISRAVARLNVLVEYCLPLVKVGGSFLAMKGPAVRDELELDGAKAAINVLGGELVDIVDWELPGGGECRSLVVIHKRRVTPKIYPRKAGLANKNPL